MQIVNVIYLIAFITLLSLGFLRILVRYIQYKRTGVKVPTLLYRDLFLFGGLGLPFLGGALFRTSGITSSSQGWYPLWVIISGGIAILGLSYWVYYEYFKIDR